MKNLSVCFLLMGLLFFTDITAQSLTQLYNSQVQSAQRYERPMGSSAGINFPSSIPHAGVVVTTVNGGRWLVHKGKDYGLDSQTVVTNAGHMSNSWYTVGAEKSISQSIVSDYVEAGGATYGLLTDNCWNAATRMMALN